MGVKYRDDRLVSYEFEEANLGQFAAAGFRFLHHDPVKHPYASPREESDGNYQPLP